MSKVINYNSPEDGVQLVRADELDSLASNWLIPDWLPEGELVILGGDGGAGKTLIAMDLVAAVSNGETRRGIFPDGTPAQYGRSLIWSCEDDWQRTLKPRLVAAGADLKECRRRSKSEPPCRPNIEPGVGAGLQRAGGG